MHTETPEDEAREAPEPLSLDPFGFQVGTSSRILGLGGDGPSYDPTYVFHTPYIAVAKGSASFTVQLHNLRAKRGTLVLRVHMLPAEAGAIARLVNSERVQLNWLAARSEGAVTINFQGYRGVNYAVMGLIPDDSDVTADAITVTLDRPVVETDDPQVHAEARSTGYGAESAKPMSQLISLEPPTLALPVSQHCSLAQFEERTYGKWIERLGARPEKSVEQWDVVFCLQALERYGMLQDGARGLGFDADGICIATQAVSLGTSIVLARPPWIDDPASIVAATPWERSSNEPVDIAQVTYRIADPNELSRDLVNFDFLWSVGVCSRLGPIAAAFRFIEAAMECLRPGGLAVHIIATLPGSDQRGTGRTDSEGFRRSDLERLALEMISYGHEVAQLKPSISVETAKPRFRFGRRAVPEAEAVGSFNSFGLIIRKPRSVI